MALEEELEEERTKYEALQQTWMAANENFLRFQVFLEINQFGYSQDSVLNFLVQNLYQ